MKSATPRVWPIPIVLGLVTGACLFVALIDDSHWDVIASVGLGAVAAYAAYKGWVEKG